MMDSFWLWNLFAVNMERKRVRIFEWMFMTAYVCELEEDRVMSPSSVYIKRFLPALFNASDKELRGVATEIFCYSREVVARSSPASFPERLEFFYDLGEERVDRYLRLIEENGDSGFGGEIQNRDVIETHLDDIRQILEQCFEHHRKKAVWIVERIGTFLGDTGRLEEQADYCLRALHVAENEEMVVSKIGLLTRLGWIYIIQGDHHQADHFLLRAKEVTEKIRSASERRRFSAEEQLEVDRRYVQVLRDLGHLRARNNRYEESIHYITQSEQDASQLGDELPKVQALLFRAWTHCLEAQREDHIQRYDDAVKILENLHTKLESYPRQQALAYRLLGEAALAQGQLAKKESYLTAVENYLGKATDIVFKRHFKQQEQVTLAFSWGRYFQARGSIDLACEQYKISAMLANMLGMKGDEERAHYVMQKIQASSPNRLSLAGGNALWDNNKKKNNLPLGAPARVNRIMHEREEFSHTTTDAQEKVQYVLQSGIEFFYQLQKCSSDEQTVIVKELNRIAGEYGLVLSGETQHTALRQEVSPELAAQAFRSIIEAQQVGYGGQPRRKPYQLQYLWDTFDEYGYTDIDLDAVAERFDQYPDIKKRRLRAQIVISKANGLFPKHGFDIEIVRHKQKYSIRPRNPYA